jgi:hypothetical protein
MNKFQGSIKIIVCVGFILSLCACRSGLLVPRVDIGTSMSNVLKRLGEPDEINTMTRTTEYIWGPAESWWDELEMGDRIEIWVYHFESGTYQVYFLNESDQVGFEAFIEKGVVY